MRFAGAVVIFGGDMAVSRRTNVLLSADTTSRGWASHVELLNVSIHVFHLLHRKSVSLKEQILCLVFLPSISDEEVLLFRRVKTT